MNQYKLYLKNKEKWENLYKTSRHINVDPQVEEIDNAIILPVRAVKGTDYYEGGVCTDNFIFKAGFVRTHGEKPAWAEVRNCYKIPENQISYEDEIVIYGGLLFTHFGHVMYELLSRLWYVVEHPECEYKIVFNTLWGIRDWYFEFFDLLGIEKNRIVFCNKAVKYRKVIVPEQTIIKGNHFNNKYKLIYEKMSSNVVAGTDEKVYISTSDDKEKRSGVVCSNEIYFENYFRNKGYRVIIPETMTLKENVSIIKGAKEVVATLGTVSHYALFSNVNTKLTCLIREGEDVLLNQIIVNEAAGVDCTLVDVSNNFLICRFNYGVALLGPTKYWEEFINDKYNETLTEEEKIMDGCYKDYLMSWCEYFSRPERFKDFKTNSHFQIINKMSIGLLGKELNPKDYVIDNIYDKQINLLKERNVELENEIAKQKDIISGLEKSVKLLQNEVEIRESVNDKIKQLMSNIIEEKIVLEIKDDKK